MVTLAVTLAVAASTAWGVSHYGDYTPSISDRCAT